LASSVADTSSRAPSSVTIVAKAGSPDHPGLDILGGVLGRGDRYFTRKLPQEKTDRRRRGERRRAGGGDETREGGTGGGSAGGRKEWVCSGIVGR
jgi:hypothetical protein